VDVFAGTNGGVFLSTNSGSDWIRANNGMTDTLVRALAISGTKLFAGTGSGGVFLSTNDGSSWTPKDTGLTNRSVFSLAFIGTNLFAGTEAGVFVSTTNGASWASTSSGLPISTSVFSLAVSGLNLIAGTNAGVFASSNRGTSWTAVNAGLKDTNVSSLAICGTGDYSTYLYAGTGGGVWRRRLSEMVTSVVLSTSELPHKLQLLQNYPNPFNPSTTIRYGLPSRSHVTLTVFNTLGQQVATLMNDTQEAGYHDVRFDGGGLASGVYFYRLQAGTYVDTKKLLLLR
jgi:ligand-binding sensor domain-containing protein